MLSAVSVQMRCVYNYRWLNALLHIELNSSIGVPIESCSSVLLEVGDTVGWIAYQRFLGLVMLCSM